MSEPEVAPRVRRIWDLHDFGAGTGLEIGPLAAAIVPRSRGDVRYADVYPREGLVAHYGPDETVDTDLIPEIDFPLWDGTRMRTLAEAAKAGAPFDWVVASHVIEHVPDLIGWLQQIEQLTGDNGALVLAVPDRRYCFDVHRPPTTVGQMLQAHDAGDTVPSVRAVYDYHRAAVTVDTGQLWNGVIPGVETQIHSPDQTQDQVQRARNGEYVDCHVWLFTPDSFVETMDELRSLGLSSWTVERLLPTPRNELEFYALLRRVSEGAASQEPARSRSGALPDWLSELQQARDDLEAAREELKRVRVEHRAKLKRLRRRLQGKEQTITTMRASRRWRVGGIVTSPGRVLRRRRG